MSDLLFPHAHVTRYEAGLFPLLEYIFQLKLFSQSIKT